MHEFIYFKVLYKVLYIILYNTLKIVTFNSSTQHMIVCWLNHTVHIWFQLYCVEYSHTASLCSVVNYTIACLTIFSVFSMPLCQLVCLFFFCALHDCLFCAVTSGFIQQQQQQFLFFFTSTHFNVHFAHLKKNYLPNLCPRGLVLLANNIFPLIYVML